MLLAASSPGVQGLNFDQLEDHSFRHAQQRIEQRLSMPLKVSNRSGEILNTLYVASKHL
jgi:hypothetical protein